MYDSHRLSVLKFMYQLKYNKLPSSFSSLNYFHLRNKPETRQTGLANCDRYRTTFTSKLPLHKFPRIWNDLESNIHNSTSLNIFKQKVKKCALDKYKINVDCTNRNCKQCYPI